MLDKVDHLKHFHKKYTPGDSEPLCYFCDSTDDVKFVSKTGYEGCLVINEYLCKKCRLDLFNAEI